FHLVHPKTNEQLTYLTRENLLKMASETPERLSPNVVTRPVVQDAIFPTVAYVAGPAEIAYFAHLKPIYDFFGVPMPIIYPRPRVSLIDPSVAKSLSKLGLTPEEIHTRDRSTVTREVISRHAEKPILDRLAGLRELQESQLRVLEEEIRIQDPGLEKAFEKLREQLATGFKKVEERLLGVLDRTNETTTRQLDKCYTSLFPGGKPQERVLCPWAPYVFNYGWDFCRQLIDKIELENFSQQFVYLEPPKR
ncbi:MAG: bacillithiol biosynthesis BshC, partial [bacterium]